MKSRKKIIRRLLSVLCCLTILVAFVLSGCSKQSEPQPTPPSTATTSDSSTEKPAKDVTLRYNWWGSQKRHDMTMEAIKIFEEKNPGIKIEPVFGDYTSYFDKLNVEIAGGNAPDIFTFDLWTVSTYLQNGSTLNLQPYVNAGKLNIDDIDKPMSDIVRLNGDLYGVTTGSLASGVIIDSDLFKELGIEIPAHSWTWDDFVNTCKEIKQKSNGKYYGSSDLSGELMFVEIWVRQYGIPHFTDGLLTDGIEQCYIEWFKMWEELRKAKAIPPAEYTVNEGWQMEQRAISLGDALMDFNSTNKVATYEGVLVNQGHTLEIISFPHQPDEKRDGGFVQPSQFIGVYSGTKYPEEAVKFLDFIANDFDGAKALGYERGVQVNAKLREKMDPILTGTDARMNKFIEYASQHYSPMDGLFPKAYEEVRAEFLKLSQTIAFGQDSIENACKKFVETANRILENKR